ncbi:MAG: hypothetical protein Harvfovirus45_3 [Harvfovirus sp.]|uniref:Uncharacterized protein n=1 Tax=Harvfovirus sp. TaxID=2487768 RepID=A0A3G5A310_9VIRU|nr:MAG: hypothetical protein Harvfovirus45_3 [Harvfovirus sp.]
MEKIQLHLRDDAVFWEISCIESLMSLDVESHLLLRLWCETYTPKNGMIFYTLAVIYQYEIDYDKMANSILEAIIFKNIFAMNHFWNYTYLFDAKKSAAGTDLLRGAADLLDKEAMFNLGRLYEIHRKDEAMVLFEKAADLGHLESIIYLWKLYDEGDSPKMIHYCLKAAEADDIESVVRAGKYYRSKKEYMKAKQMLEKGVKLGAIAAANKLGCLYESLGNKEKALEYFQLASKSGDSYYSPTGFWNCCITHLKKGDKILALDCVAKAYELYSTEKDKNECLEKVDEIVNSMEKGMLIEYILGNREKTERIRALERRVEELEIEIDFSPGGKGAVKAEEHFHAVAKS